MKLLFDTQLLLWAIGFPDLLPRMARDLIADAANEVFFSSVAIWEIAIKQALQRATFTVDAEVARDGLLRSGYRELPLKSDHALKLLALPYLHRDPFDRILVAQAISEGMTLVTADGMLARYPGPIFKVG